MAFVLPELPYDYKALEPHIDARTMEIHYTKHHAAYLNNLNMAIKDTPLADLTIEAIMKDASKHSSLIRNNSGGFYNHNLFWNFLSPNGGGEPTGELAEAIKNDLGGFDKFKADFTQASLSRFGSGWAWLVATSDGLKVSSTPNQDNPLMDVADVKGTPILGLDVWEHAYYLNYQNRRNEYVEAFFSIVNWDEVSRLYKLAL
jgi:Fe-Mn family superoxide dismutase